MTLKQLHEIIEEFLEEFDGDLEIFDIQLTDEGLDIHWVELDGFDLEDIN